MTIKNKLWLKFNYENNYFLNAYDCNAKIKNFYRFSYSCAQINPKILLKLH